MYDQNVEYLHYVFSDALTVPQTDAEELPFDDKFLRPALSEKIDKPPPSFRVVFEHKVESKRENLSVKNVIFLLRIFPGVCLCRWTGWASW